MIKPKLFFTKYTNSFTVHIQNLEQLSVEQIQEFQNFVSLRRGIFDFETYSFVIQKRLEFEDFITLIKQSGMEVICEEKVYEQSLQPRINFGEYKGMFYSQLPESYLKWLKTSYRGRDRDILEAEIKRRNL